MQTVQRGQYFTKSLIENQRGKDFCFTMPSMRAATRTYYCSLNMETPEQRIPMRGVGLSRGILDIRAWLLSKQLLEGASMTEKCYPNQQRRHVGRRLKSARARLSLRTLASCNWPLSPSPRRSLNPTTTTTFGPLQGPAAVWRLLFTQKCSAIPEPCPFLPGLLVDGSLVVV